MYRLYLSEIPYIACSSGNLSNEAISIIRIGGFKKLDIFSAFFSIDIKSIESHRVYLTDIKRKSTILDTGMVCFFRAPKSYNGENILEISVHGNRINVRNIIEMFITSGKFREAEPGEFTYRALKNGKLNLAQVEGLDTLINANSNYVLNEGLSHLNGELQKKYEKLFESLKSLKAAIELKIEFAEDVDDNESNKNIESSVQEFKNIIEELYNRSQVNYSGILNPKVVICGPPNVGKSTLFNSFLGHERSITDSEEGTTRDYVTENIFLSGNQFTLVDTAGIRDSNNKVEQEGIKRTLLVIEDSFFRIMLVKDREVKDTFIDKIKSLKFDYVIALGSEKGNDKFKAEFIRRIKSGPIGPENSGGPIGPEKNGGPIGPPFSDEILKEIKKKIIFKYESITCKKPITIERHRRIINDIHEQFMQFQKVIIIENDLGIVINELEILENMVANLLGVVFTDDVMDLIFSNFCIGK